MFKMAPGRLGRVYRSCLFQIVVVGLVAFCEPGIWTALNNLGAGGNATVSFFFNSTIAAAVKYSLSHCWSIANVLRSHS